MVSARLRRSGVDRKLWKWFDTMDTTSTDTDRRVEEERGGIDTTTSLLEAMLEPTGKMS